MRHPTAGIIAGMSRRELISLLEEAEADYQDERSAQLVHRIETELDEREIMEWDDQDTQLFTHREVW